MPANGLRAFLDDRLRQHGRGRRAVAGDVAGFGRHLADHLGAHVLKLVFELDFLGDRDTILGNPRRAEGFLDHDVAAFRPECHLDGVCQRIDAAQHAVASFR